MTTPEVITSSSALADIAGEAKRTGAFGIDTEFMRERTYRAQLCLVQIASGESISIVDPLAGVDFAPIAELLADPDVEVVVHAGRQDLELFHDEFSVVPTKVFDVQVAAGFAGYGASLSYGALVKNVVDVTLTKGESYTDWCRRPLTTKQKDYAADDVRWLLQAAAALKERLSQMGRLKWAIEEMAPLGKADTYSADLDEVWRRVSGRGGLSGRQLAALRELARWREEAAIRRNLPRGWVMKDATLVDIARRQPTSLEALGRIRGLNPKEVDRSGRDVLQAVERAKSTEAPQSAAPPPREDQIRTRLIGGLADVVVRTRAEAAGVAPELVATRGDIESLLLQLFASRRRSPNGPLDHRLLKGWRKELAGDAVVALAEGRVGVRSIEDPPYVEEVQV
ncbi:MAG: ribonuclease D [Actinomycetota bacterium]|nr:ribonuclease D [Actinomycetota bacterium]